MAPTRSVVMAAAVVAAAAAVGIAQPAAAAAMPAVVAAGRNRRGGHVSSRLRAATRTTSTPTGPNNRPIIGILSNPNSISGFNGTSYFPASYVKWLESAGARVVPLLFDDPAGVAALLPYLNGALFTGGGTSFTYPNGTLTPFTQTAAIIYAEATTAWAKGETWPLWGTCQGHELIAFIASGYNMSTVTGPFNSENYTIPLDFTAAAPSSTLYGSLPASVYDVFDTEAVTMNNHQLGVTPAGFAAAPSLASAYTVLSTNLDRNGAIFISSMEGTNGLPIFTTQYHPEKCSFEWENTEVIDHSFDAVVANNYLATVFVQQVRNNLRAFPSTAAEMAALIYNYAPAYTASVVSFDQCYFFTP